MLFTICKYLLKFWRYLKHVKYANKVTDDVIHSNQYYIKYIVNKAFLANMQCRPWQVKLVLQEIHLQGSKLMLANSQNASDFDKLQVRKISTSKLLRVRIIHVSQTFGKNLQVVSPVCQYKKSYLPNFASGLKS